MNCMKVKQGALIAASVCVVLAAGALAEPEATDGESAGVFDALSDSGISLGGVVEVETSIGREDGDDASDVALATVELGIAAELTELISAEAVLLWEEDDTEPVDLDTAVITIGGTDEQPLFVEAGKLYVPFGVYESSMVSDPLTLELGETRESAVLAGYRTDTLDVQIGLFNGDVDKAGDDDHADNWIASIMVTPVEGLMVGASYISDLGDSDGLEEGLREAIEGDEETPGLDYDEAYGFAVFVGLEMDPVAVHAEYVTAGENFAAGLLADTAVKPQAWNVEVSASMSERLAVALRFEGADEFPGMPEAQCGVCVSYALADTVGLALEYMHGSFDNDTDDRDMVTAQLAAEF